MGTFVRSAFFGKKKRKKRSWLTWGEVCTATLCLVKRAIVSTFPDDVGYLASMKYDREIIGVVLSCKMSWNIRGAYRLVMIKGSFVKQLNSKGSPHRYHRGSVFDAAARSSGSISHSARYTVSFRRCILMPHIITHNDQYMASTMAMSEVECNA